MTLTMPNLRDSIRPERVNAVMAFGFTERQARFLVHVLVHAGVFIQRQYRAFARIAHGQKTHDFLSELVGRGYGHRDHARRTASRPPLSCPVQAALRGHRVSRTTGTASRRHSAGSSSG